MAQFGAKKPYFAPIKDEPENELPTYEGTPFRIGRLVKADLTVTMASGKLNADDALAESVDEFVSGSVAMETDDMTDEVASKVYGAKVEDKEIHYKAGDTPPMGGMAFIRVLMRGGKKIYKGVFFPKVKAVLGNESNPTKGDSITFGTSATTFTVFACNSDDWRIMQEFDTEAEAEAWVKEKLGVEPAA